MKALALACNHPSSPVRLTALSIALGTAVKLWLAATTIGTNDLPSFYFGGRAIAEYGTVAVYHRFPIFNQPPFVTSLLWIMDYFLAPYPAIFPFLFRLPMIAADAGSAVILWKLGSAYWSPGRALFAVVLVSLNPVLIMISGFHGNTDTIMIFLVLAAAYAVAEKKSWAASAFLLGLAIDIKIVPVIVLPAFFFWLPGWRQRLGFAALVLAVVLAGFGYHLWVAFADVVKKVFLYGSFWGIWGLGRVFMPRRPPIPTAGHIWFPVISRYAILGLIVFSAMFKARQSYRQPPGAERSRGPFLFEAIAWAFLIFLILAPGFGIQYLSWLIGPGVFLGLFGVSVYTVVASVFLFRVYTFWSGGFPWYYADSINRGLWTGFDKVLDGAVWIALVLWASFLLAQGIQEKIRNRKMEGGTFRCSPGPLQLGKG